MAEQVAVAVPTFAAPCGRSPVGEGEMAPACFDHDATGLRADRRPSAACKKQTCRTIRCNSLSLAPCSSCGWVSTTAGAIESPTPCRQQGPEPRASQLKAAPNDLLSSSTAGLRNLGQRSRC